MEDILMIAKQWITEDGESNLPELFYCRNNADFRVRWQRFSSLLSEKICSETTAAIIAAVVGEIGNNSFDHNLGNWPDLPGVFFAFDKNSRFVVLADRGQGVLTTLKKVRPNIISDEEALKIAFSEVVTSRAPEPRGNGLKFVRQVVASNNFKLDFYSGSAFIHLDDGLEPTIERTDLVYHGCLVKFCF